MLFGLRRRASGLSVEMAIHIITRDRAKLAIRTTKLTTSREMKIRPRAGSRSARIRRRLGLGGRRGRSVPLSGAAARDRREAACTRSSQLRRRYLHIGMDSFWYGQDSGG